MKRASTISGSSSNSLHALASSIVSNEAPSDDSVQLNQQRRALLAEVQALKKKRSALFSNIQKHIAELLEDHADRFFSNENTDYKSFYQRYDASLKAMVRIRLEFRN